VLCLRYFRHHELKRPCRRPQSLKHELGVCEPAAPRPSCWNRSGSMPTATHMSA